MGKYPEIKKSVADSTQPLSNEEANPITTYHGLTTKMNAIFGDILPRVSVRSFRPSQAPLYVPNRQHSQQSGQSSEDYSLEKLLDKQFWDTDAPPVVIIKGDVGTGKTTLINFYLRSYCPYLSPHSARFSEKLYIYVDMKAMQTESHFNTKLLTEMTRAILSRCASINYDIEANPDVNKAYKEGDWLWPYRAIQHIRAQTQAGNDGIPFKYTVICLDNLDQCSTAVQQRAIAEVRDWVTGPTTINPYRVYISVWPKTFESILNTFGEPLARNLYESVNLNQINTEEIHGSRTKSLHSHLHLSTPTSEPSDLDRRAKALANEPTNHKLARFIATAAESFSSRCLEELQHASNGNLRSILKCCYNMFRSSKLYDVWTSRTGSGDRLSRYDVLEACLVGPHKYFCQEQSGFPNLFAIVTEFPLIAVHLLSFLVMAPELPVSRITDSLQAIGYPEFAITEVLRAFEESDCQPFYAVLSSFKQGSKYVISQRSVKSLLKLSSDPLYVDVMSVVTPVEERYLPRMRLTSSSDSRDFKNRVETSMAFIEYLSNCEVAFLQALLDIQTSKEKQHVADILKYQVRLPMIAERMRTGYLQRIRSLSKLGYLGGISRDWWDDIESRLEKCLHGLPDEPCWESLEFILAYGK